MVLFKLPFGRPRLRDVAVADSADLDGTAFTAFAVASAAAAAAETDAMAAENALFVAGSGGTSKDGGGNGINDGSAALAAAVTDLPSFAFSRLVEELFVAVFSSSSSTTSSNADGSDGSSPDESASAELETVTLDESTSTGEYKNNSLDAFVGNLASSNRTVLAAVAADEEDEKESA